MADPGHGGRGNKVTGSDRIGEDLDWLDLFQRDSVVLTKSQLARRHIKKMILSGQVRPGDRLTTREVSEALDISETPCREAINGLAAEGWLDVQSHIGAVVRALDLHQLKEISALRGMVCGLAIELNADRYDEAFLSRLDDNISRAEIALERRKYDSFSALNYLFHKMLCDGPNSVFCYRILENMLGMMSPSRHGVPSYHERLVEAISEHRDIRDRLRRKDIAGAAAIARQHELNTGTFLIAKMTELEEAAAAAAAQVAAPRRRAAG